MIKQKKMYIKQNRIKPITILECIQADGLASVAKSERELQININIWNKKMKKAGLKISMKKQRS